jgi:agmatine deiminase
MIEALLPFVRIKVVTESDSIQSVCQLYLANRNIDTTQIQFYVIPDNEFWMRDHGAVFLKNKLGEKEVVDFGWNTYGIKSWMMNLYENDQQKVDSTMNKMLASKRGKVDSLMAVAENIPIRKSPVFIEGGAIEVNGKGTLILNEPLTLSRNEGRTKVEIEAEFKKALGVRNIIWLKHGLAEDPHIWQIISDNYVGIGTGGHTDEFVRFANANTILLAWVEESEKDNNPLNRINYDRMKENFEILSRALDENGKPFSIIKVPLPDPIIKPVALTKSNSWDESLNIPISVFPKNSELIAGDTVRRVAASSYLDCFVTNGAVLLPTYIKEGSSPAKEEKVKQIFSEIFPGRKLIFIDVMALNWEGGGIHCGTQQQPK